MFDRKVFHDGIDNSYEFVKDGQSYKLVPMLEKKMDSNKKGMDNSNNKVPNDSNSKNMHGNDIQIMLCSSKEFLREKKHSGCCLAIIPKRIQEREKGFYINPNSTLVKRI
jgi:hypothetical protein